MKYPWQSILAHGSARRLCFTMHAPGGGACAALILLPVFFCAGIAQAASAAPSKSVLVKTITLKPRNLAQILVAYGQVKPDPGAVKGISVAHGGEVDSLSVSVGQRVKPGQVLLKLVTSPQSRLGYYQAQAQLAYAKQDLAHVKALYAQKLATNDQLAAAKKQLASAKAAFAAEKAKGSDQAIAVIRAPFEGVVGAIKVAPGDRVAANTVLMTLFNPDRLRVPLGVSRNDLMQLQVGMPVKLISVFNDALAVRTQLDQLQAVVDPKTHLMDALVTLRGKQTDGFNVGMWVKGLITVGHATELAVPRQAVLHDIKGSYIFVVNHGKAHRVDVHTEFATGFIQRWIGVKAKALQAGDKVVTLGNYELHDGMAVREQAAQ